MSKKKPKKCNLCDTGERKYIFIPFKMKGHNYYDFHIKQCCGKCYRISNQTFVAKTDALMGKLRGCFLVNLKPNNLFDQDTET